MGGGGRSPSDGPPQPQFQCNLKENFLRCPVFPVLFGPSDGPPHGGGDCKGGGGGNVPPSGSHSALRGEVPLARERSAALRVAAAPGIYSSCVVPPRTPIHVPRPWCRRTASRGAPAANTRGLCVWAMAGGARMRSVTAAVPSGRRRVARGLWWGLCPVGLQLRAVPRGARGSAATGALSLRRLS